MASCNICDDEITKQNPIFICVRCDVKVHKLCYGADGSPANWKCSPCRLDMKLSIQCKLCCQKGGAMKQTVRSDWVHVICALFMKGVIFSNERNMEPVNISKVPKCLQGKMCSICNTKKGYSTTCAEAKCNKKMHITCAQAENTLKEEVNLETDSIRFEAYCIEHKPSGSSRRLSSGSVQDKTRKMTSKLNDSVSAWILGEATSHSTPTHSDKKRQSK